MICVCLSIVQGESEEVPSQPAASSTELAAEDHEQESQQTPAGQVGKSSTIIVEELAPATANVANALVCFHVKYIVS